MINTIKKIYHSNLNERRSVDRRKDHVCAEISDNLAEQFPEDFPLLKKRAKSRRDD